jgi:flavorubredoxin
MHPAPFTPTRHEPLEIAPDTFVIHAAHGEGVAPQVVHMNSMVIRGAEPVVVDTGAPVHREQYLADLFGLVEPEDVRWVFISHEDLDHVGNVEAVMDACPNAVLVSTWFLCERMTVAGLTVPPTRWRWVGDGETLDVGDRTLVAHRPPLYDEPTTRGLFDPTTGVYWGSDAFATPVPAPLRWASELAPEAWEAGFATFHHWNSPWAAMLDEARFAAEVERLERLGIRTIATCHGPTVEEPLVPRALGMLRAVPSAAAVPPQPGQPLLDEIIDGILAASPPA